MLKIIAGKYKGIKLNLPLEFFTRPSSSRLRESVFNILSPINWEDVSVCDAFAGSGAMGLEALSRGARNIVFCEKSTEVLKTLHTNINKITKTNNDNIEIFNDFFKTNKDYSFDIIFLDPPFNANLYEKSINFIKENGLLKNNGIVIIEHKTGTEISNFNLDIIQKRKYGNCQITFSKIL